MTKAFAWQEPGTSHVEPDGYRFSLLAAAQHARTVIDALVKLDPSSARILEIAQLLEDAAALVDSWQLDNPVVSDARAEVRNEAYRDRSPVTGRANPLSPPVEVMPEGQYGARAVIAMGLAYQGPPGRVHGGYVATLLDHVMGYAAGTSGSWVFTRTLTVDYDHAVPLFEELEISGKIERFDGRKIWVTGQILSGGRIVAKAQGMWVGPRTNAIEN